MPRRAAITPNRILTTSLPADLATRVELLLWSDVEGKIPYGAWQEFLVKLIREYFANRNMDLGPFLNSLPGVHVISGSDHTLSALLTHLKTRRSE
jgi:hypothetical protein